ncbi:MAG: gamma-glutamyltransferase family protein, partial [Rhodobacteraceae bacterium]|nr:gamma-glutamyltransferase family protein [Paracoccaceae bacterium]
MRDFHQPGRSPVFAANGICATSHPLAAATAVRVMQEGGNAVDAAIAAAVLLGICEPQMTGLGGDCFVLVKPAGSDEVVALNGSGRAPAALDPETLRGRGLTAVPVGGPEAVTIPGAVDAFCRLSERYGRWGLDRVLAPAIRYAEDGVPVAPRVAFDWEEEAAALQSVARRHFLRDGAVPRPGQMFRAPGQAEVLRRIARDGRSAFYEGEVAADMLAALRAAGGVHTEADFAVVEATWGSPIAGDYRGTGFLEHPPNGQGATAILIANILSHFDIAGMDPLGADRIHLEAEATKLGYDARNRFLADPDHMTRLDHMLSVETAQRLAALIDPARALPDPAAAAEAVHRDTIYLTVVDRDRMAVSLIYSIYHAFGSGIATDRFGILLHNRGAGFTLAAGHPNEARGGKRPMHTIIPAMLTKGGRVTMPFGVMGGAYQATGHARLISDIVDFGMHPQQSFDCPRAFTDSGELKLERGVAPAVAGALEARGHRIAVPHGPIGGAQAIVIDEA